MGAIANHSVHSQFSLPFLRDQMLQIIFNYLKTFSNLGYYATTPSTVAATSLAFMYRPPLYQHFVLPFILLRRSFERKTSQVCQDGNGPSVRCRLLESDNGSSPNDTTCDTIQEPLTRKKIKLDHLEWNATKACLIGSTLVHNIAYEKKVIVRYTCNNWKTWKEVEATYQTSVSKAIDRFMFQFSFPPSSSQQETSHCCQIAIRYEVAGNEFWDNNDGRNYIVGLLVQQRSQRSYSPKRYKENESIEKDGQAYIYA